MEQNLENNETLLSKKHHREDEEPKVENKDKVVYCLKVKNIPKFTNDFGLKKEIREMLGNDSLKCKVEKKYEWTDAYVTLYNEEECKKLLNLFNENKIKIQNNILKAYLAEERKPQNTNKKNKNQVNNNIQNENVPKNIHDQITPLHNMPYSEQLSFKKESIFKVFPKKLADILDDTVPSPLVDGYRNKNEFSIGFNSNGLPGVGFRMSTFAQGMFYVESSKDYKHINDAQKNICQYFERIFKDDEFKEYPIYDFHTKKGIWKLLIIRSNIKNENLVAVQVHPQELTEQQLKELKEKIIKYFSTEEANSLNIRSLQIQISNSVHNGIDIKAPIEILKGEEYLEEYLFNDSLKFRISLNSFFQVNTPCTEKLYSCIKDLALGDEDNSQSTLLDLCCGTGTIGISMAKYFKNVIGIEMIKEAVQDAETNAKVNNIDNIKFICSKLEDCIDNVIKGIDPSHNIVVVLDPPRNGAHPSVMNSLKSLAYAQNMKRIIFVSCNPELAKKNFQDLIRFPHFVPDKAIPIDLFPHTKHCELVVRFARKK